MARSVKDANLATRTARMNLPPRKRPHHRLILQGLHLGYYKGTRTGSWNVRRFIGEGRYEETKLGTADDVADADGITWVDQRNTRGLGDDVPISTGNENDALLAPVKGKWVVLRVPYPLRFYAKGLDGRIDDPNGGWRARGLWTTSSDRTPWLKEGGKGTTPLALHIQLRPNPLAD